MERAKKFGTFGGVFTPSLLTILGVIMYLRLGWVVGQAGLVWTVGIILVAHIISVTTGLSLSSIATDKKIKAGGIYYMLSRSLGLPIGGAIGATIFLAIALSISLYIVGFAESFLAVDAISNWLGLEMSVQSIRIIGTIVIALLTIIAFISTSLAIKVQYFVLTAIVLSLTSIFVGLFAGSGHHPAVPSVSPFATAPSIEVLFAIFFPAVTGFTVGVAMSGDLKDPRSSIPKGTLLAIFTGLIIYLSMAIGFSLFVDRQLLLEDSAFLMKVAWLPVLVIAGIWGATLSSALGGILGGPRIVQAMARDKLAPSLFGRGFGINNEPRIAIIFTFLIAQAGILIGDLNTIARVVSMFYIAAYGFINLAFALESWASTDFRPSFRIPRWVGWLGFFASILVMTQIDFAAMLIALFLIWLTWFLMKRKARKLEPGDVWQSVWSSVIRHSLHNLATKGIEERNWKPNILLFGGNPDTRSKFAELGKALIADQGLLSIIELKKIPTGEKTKPRFTQNQQTPESLQNKGVFTREYYTHDFYAGMENLAETYGFAGVEPNTVLMGWARDTTAPERFVQLIKHMIRLDLNLLLVNYHLEKGFGKRKTIDIWWRGSGNNGNLAINLVKFLWLSDQWKDSKTRLMIENPVNDERENIYNFAYEVLDNLRVNAEIVIINNEIEKKSFYDIIRIESSTSDIVFLGIPDIEDETDFIEKTNALCSDLGTVVLIKASTQFKQLNIGLRSTPAPKLVFDNKSSDAGRLDIHTPLPWPRNPRLREFMVGFSEKIHHIDQDLIQKGFGKTITRYAEVIANAHGRVNATFGVIERKLAEHSHHNLEKTTQTLYKLTHNTFTRYVQILTDLKTQVLESQQKNLEVFFSHFNDRMDALQSEIPEKLVVEMQQEDLIPHPEDRNGLAFFKWRKRNAFRNPPRHTVKLRKIIARSYPETYQQIKKRLWKKFFSLSQAYLVEQQKAFRQFRDSLQTIENAIAKNNFSPELIRQEKEHIDKIFARIKDFPIRSSRIFSEVVKEETFRSLVDICRVLDAPNPNHAKGHKHVRIKKHEVRSMLDYPAGWKHSQQAQINEKILEVTLSSVDYKMWHFIERALQEMKRLSCDQNTSYVLQKTKQVRAFIDHCTDALKAGKKLPDSPPDVLPDAEQQRRVKDIEDFTLERIHAAISRVPSHMELPRKQGTITDYTTETQRVEVSRMIHFIIQSNLTAPFQQHMGSFGHGLSAREQEIIETSRLIKITLTGDQEEPLHLPSVSFFEEQKTRIENNILKLFNHQKSADDKLHNALNQTGRHLSFGHFLKTAENFKMLEKSKGADKKGISWHLKIIKSFTDLIRQNLIRLWYDRSKRIVYAHQNKTAAQEESFPVSQLHALNEAVSVKQHILKDIPPYYQQLFLRKNNYFMDFWHGKPNELLEAHKTIARHQKGYNGALLVKGEHNSGKTFFVNYMAHKHLADRQVYSLQPPYGGSCSEADFLRALQKTIEMPVSADKILKSLPENTVIIIEDLELWWEKTSTGFKVIRLICDLIEKYGQRILFVITVNSHAYRSINRFVKMDSFLLSTIECHPFNAGELKEIILQRHRAGNMRFVFNQRKEKEMRSWDYARLFNTYFNYTRGNVGLCLQTWMASIVKADNQVITIKPPQKPDTTVLNRLDSETLIFLVQFILHKRLNTEKIQRIMLMTMQQVQQKIRFLKRAAIITEPRHGVYTLNPNLHAFIRARFMEKELL